MIYQQVPHTQASKDSLNIDKNFKNGDFVMKQLQL